MLLAFAFAVFVTIIGLGISILIIPGIKANSLTAFLIAATVLALINTSLRPILWFLTAPLSIMSFGLFALLINAAMIMLSAALVPGFRVKGLFSAFLAALIMAGIGALVILAIPLFTDAEISWQSYEYRSTTPPSAP